VHHCPYQKLHRHSAIDKHQPPLPAFLSNKPKIFFFSLAEIEEDSEAASELCSIFYTPFLHFLFNLNPSSSSSFSPPL
jgi:hypothetical protein